MKVLLIWNRSITKTKPYRLMNAYTLTLNLFFYNLSKSKTKTKKHALYYLLSVTLGHYVLTYETLKPHNPKQYKCQPLPLGHSQCGCKQKTQQQLHATCSFSNQESLLDISTKVALTETKFWVLNQLHWSVTSAHKILCKY